ncbi:hypothetical protein Vadar_009132 [Vaccinium darrowii]|uniref:Uncharacterized protein n=1 Tax=Vaccinium darrowii TaxID=229202 RepID=A0ACB7YCH1_9ERIC|nr:hypothetical protein Vadar_009132 [Vaccinium darrowii]
MPHFIQSYGGSLMAQAHRGYGSRMEIELHEIQFPIVPELEWPSTPFPAKESVALAKKTLSKASRIRCMKTWNPIDNKKFETLSYLPPLTEESIAKEVDYMIKKGWIPCLEFDAESSISTEIKGERERSGKQLLTPAVQQPVSADRSSVVQIRALPICLRRPHCVSGDLTV